MGTVLLFLFATAFACDDASGGQAHQDASLDNGRISLDAPAGLGAGKTLRLRVSVGVLPHGAKVVVRSPAGELYGQITPFGVRAGEKAGLYTIAIHNDAIIKGKVPLRLEIVPKREKPRVPTKDEVEAVRLEVIPVAPSTNVKEQAQKSPP